MRGLIAEGNVQQAKNNADNVRFLIHKYGFMQTATAPFISATHSHRFIIKWLKIFLKKRGDKGWLKESYDALVKEYGYWQTNRTAPNGLNVYGPHKDYTKEYIEEKYDYFKYRYRGFEAKTRKKSPPARIRL